MCDLEDYEYVSGKIREEGLDYCFLSYGSFLDIDDVVFHKLRLDYIESSNRLTGYIKNKITELSDND